MCESLANAPRKYGRCYYDAKGQTSSPKRKRWIFRPLFGSGDLRCESLVLGFGGTQAVDTEFLYRVPIVDRGTILEKVQGATRPGETGLRASEREICL